ncbi:MAG TPA: hypothetical protein VJL84_01490, partial [Kiloniellales bacterium]|nr:hypothetical protein [Kiloniellales bacterium]
MRLLIALLLLLLALPAAADETVVITTPETDDAGDRHAGYYYPPPESFERYEARGPAIKQANRNIRVAFITGLEVELAKRGHPVPYAVFAKGSEAEKLIVVALMDGPMDTLYRARAVLANMTAEARLLPLLKQNGVEDWFTFLDLCVLLGFQQVTLSDGK